MIEFIQRHYYKFFSIHKETNAIIIIRFLVSYVFVTEGIQKFVYTESLGVGRFLKIGIPFPEIMAPFVGVFEIIFGILIGIGLFTRLATIPLLIIMAVAISTTKIPLLESKGILTFSHESRNDLAMIFTLVFLFFVGSGAYSLDQFLKKKDKS